MSTIDDFDAAINAIRERLSSGYRAILDAEDALMSLDSAHNAAFQALEDAHRVEMREARLEPAPMTWERSIDGGDPKLYSGCWVRTQRDKVFAPLSRGGSILVDADGDPMVLFGDPEVGNQVVAMPMDVIIAVGPTPESVQPPKKPEPSTFDTLTAIHGPQRFRWAGGCWEVCGHGTDYLSAGLVHWGTWSKVTDRHGNTMTADINRETIDAEALLLEAE